MNKIKFRLYIEHFLDREDRHGTMIAGGIFSVYQSQSLFAQKMPDLFKLMKNNQDISYNSNNIFLPIGIFSEFKRINIKFQVLDLFHDVYSDIESLVRTEFVKYVNA